MQEVAQCDLRAYFVADQSLPEAHAALVSKSFEAQCDSVRVTFPHGKETASLWLRVIPSASVSPGEAVLPESVQRALRLRRGQLCRLVALRMGGTPGRILAVTLEPCCPESRRLASRAAGSGEKEGVGALSSLVAAIRGQLGGALLTMGSTVCATVQGVASAWRAVDVTTAASAPDGIAWGVFEHRSSGLFLRAMEGGEGREVTSVYASELTALSSFVSAALAEPSTQLGGLEAARPRALLLHGPSGSGKSHLLRCLQHGVSPQHRVVRLTGLDLQAAASRARLAQPLPLAVPDASVSDSLASLGMELVAPGPLRSAVEQLASASASSMPAQDGKAGHGEGKGSGSSSGSGKATAGLLILLDDVDALLRQESGASSQLLSFLQWLGGACVLPCCLVAAASSRAVDGARQAFLRAGRFERVISLRPPAASQRSALLASCAPSLPAALVSSLSSRTSGLLPADLTALLRHASLNASLHAHDALPQPQLPHYEAAIREGGASSRREMGLAEGGAGLDAVPWSAVAGYAKAKRRLKLIAQQWAEAGSTTSSPSLLARCSGVLLHGPPGCGKTLMTRAVASQPGLTCIPVRAADLFSKWLGESERIVRSLFRQVLCRAASLRHLLPALLPSLSSLLPHPQASQLRPCVIVLEDLEAIGARRLGGGDGHGDGDGGGKGVEARVLSALLNELDGVSGRPGVFLLATTSRLPDVDAALLRPGRLDELIELTPPSSHEQLDILRAAAHGLPLAHDVDFTALVAPASDPSEAPLSCADLVAICKEGAVNAFRQAVQEQAQAQGRRREEAEGAAASASASVSVSVSSLRVEQRHLLQARQALLETRRLRSAAAEAEAEAEGEDAGR